MSLLNAAKALLLRTAAGHMGEYLYAENGSALWADVAQKDPNYYLSRCDQDLLQESLPEISQLLPKGMALIDVGPGDNNAIEGKSVPLLKALESNTYHPVDISAEFLQNAADIVKKEVPTTTVVPHKADYTQGKQIEKDALVYIGGASVGNLGGPVTLGSAASALRDLLKSFGAMIDKKGWLLVSFDSNQDEVSVKRTYGGQMTADFVKNVLYIMQTELPIKGLKPDEFKYTPKWNATEAALEHEVEAGAEQNIVLDDVNVDVRAAETFHLANSYKFSEKQMEKAAQDAGFQLVRMFRHKTPMRLALLKAL